MPRNDYESYPTTTMETVAGNVKVPDQSYGIQGQVVDSTMDTPIDMNAIAGAEAPPSGMQLPETGMLQEFEGNETKGASDPLQENPEQSFSPNAERKQSRY